MLLLPVDLIPAFRRRLDPAFECALHQTSLSRDVITQHNIGVETIRCETTLKLVPIVE